MANYGASASASAGAGLGTPLSPVESSRASSQLPPPSSTGGHNQASQQPPGHKRVYQACIPCRRRKVRCDLGSVDNPHDPPCVRCRRESKECYFSATRRKRKTDDPAEQYNDEDEYVVRNGRKRLHADDSPPPTIDRRLYSEVPLTPGGSMGRSRPLERPLDGMPRRSDHVQRRSATFEVDGEPNMPMENYEARTVMRREVYGPHDALDLLYKAATDNRYG